jgi:hypothetical protein
VQPAVGSVGRSKCSCPPHPRSLRAGVGGQVDKVEGYIEEMVGLAIGSQGWGGSMAVSQGVTGGTRILSLCHQDIPGPGTLSQGFPFDH